MLKRRSGWLARRCPPWAWDTRPLETFLRDGELAAPDRYADFRRGKGPEFFFAPAAIDQYTPLLAQWDASFRSTTEIDGGNPAPLTATHGSSPSTVADRAAPAVSLAGAVVAGRLPYFSHRDVEVGFPPDWHNNTDSGRSSPRDRHWSRIDEFAFGDVKVIWEPNRFTFTYALVRAYWRTGDERFAEAFWSLVEDWRANNPPQLGVNWLCGQEVALRTMAWCFGLYGFLASAHTTPQRMVRMAQLIAASAERIEANLAYAVSQQNNHAVSEAAGLWTVGLLFPEFSSSQRWVGLGGRQLEACAETLIYPGGGFSQHSFNYQRVMLHVMLWAVRLGEIAGKPLSVRLRERVAASGELLYQVQDAATGRVPCYGANDGALVLPLSNCDYRDFRPVVQAISMLTRGQRLLAPGPWDEDLLWLFGPSALHADVRGDERRTFGDPLGGYCTLRTQSGYLFTRCAGFRHRPSHADQLHVDVWWKGINVAIDPGSYSYNARPPWHGALASTDVHNTVTVDGEDQMPRASRFLWVDWANGTMQPPWTTPAGRIEVWQGEHDGYRRLKSPVVHARSVCRLDGEHWLVVDRLVGAATHEYRLHWLLVDAPYRWMDDASELILSTVAGDYHIRYGLLAGEGEASLVRADPAGIRGWQSPYYGDKQPALSLEMKTKASSATFWSLLGPPVQSATYTEGAFHISDGRWQASAQLARGEGGPIFDEIRYQDSQGVTDRWISVLSSGS